MKNNLAIVVCLFVVFLWGSVRAGTPLPRSTPEAEGVSSSQLQSFIEAADASIDGMNSFMLLRHGRVVAEGWWGPYRAEARHSLFSLSKSFTSTAIGLAIAEGKLSLDDPVLKFFPDDAPAEPSEYLKAMRVSDLLRMSTGQQAEPPRLPDQHWVKKFLAQPVPFKPGTHFLYNTSATYVLSSIIQKVTGMTLLDYLRPRLFDPLGIEGPTWDVSPQGISTGGYGLSIRTEDIARFGQLYLQKGVWEGKRLVPESWVEAATARQTSNGSNPNSDWDQGYGYQFWRCRHGAYRGDGAFGQYCVALPEQDAVIAITGGLGNMQAVLDLVWDKLLPAFKPAPLPAEDASRAKLERTLKGLVLRAQEGVAIPAQLSATRYVFPKNDLGVESVTLETGEKSDTLTLRSKGTDQKLVCGHGQWIDGRLTLGTFLDQPQAASGAWIAPGTYQAKTCFYESPYTLGLRLRFYGDRLRIDIERNVGFGAIRQPPLFGKAE